MRPRFGRSGGEEALIKFWKRAECGWRFGRYSWLRCIQRRRQMLVESGWDRGKKSENKIRRWRTRDKVTDLWFYQVLWLFRMRIF